MYLLIFVVVTAQGVQFSKVWRINDVIPRFVDNYESQKGSNGKVQEYLKQHIDIHSCVFLWNCWNYAMYIYIRIIYLLTAVIRVRVIALFIFRFFFFFISNLDFHILFSLYMQSIIESLFFPYFDRSFQLLIGSVIL